MVHVTNEWGAREGRCRHTFTCGCELPCVRTKEHGRGVWWLTSEVAAHRSSHPQSQLGRGVRV